MSASTPSPADIAYYRKRLAELRQQWNETCGIPLGMSKSYTHEQQGQCGLIEWHIKGVLMWLEENDVSEVETIQESEVRHD